MRNYSNWIENVANSYNPDSDSMLRYRMFSSLMDADKDAAKFVKSGAAMVVLFVCLGVVNNKRHLYDRIYSLQPHRQLIIVEKWSEIEKLVSTIFKKKVITIQDVLPQLLDLCKDEVTVDEVSNVLFLRNKIVHENTMLSDFEINNTIDIENRIIALLKAKIEDTYGC